MEEKASAFETAGPWGLTQMIASLTWGPTYLLEVAGSVVSVHSVGIAVGYVAGYFFLKHRAEQMGRWTPGMGEALVVAIPGVLLGSRLGFALPFWLSGRSLPSSEVTTLAFTNIDSVRLSVGAEGP